ncbi:MAG: FAD-dependent oxidoreductase [Bryobacteraceae bacterium]
MGREPMTARLVEIRDIAPGVRHFVFELVDIASFGFVPGQFVSFTHETNDNVLTRAYSLAAPPAANRFEISLNKVEGGRFSPHLFSLQPGGELPVTGPWGAFILREPVRDTLLVASGTGIVPFRAILMERLAKDNAHQFTLIHGTRYESTLLYGGEFESMRNAHPNFRYWPTLSRPHAAWAGRTGYVQRHILEAVAGRSGINVFICGLKAMVNEVRAMLKDAGFDRKQINYEKYD